MIYFFNYLLHAGYWNMLVHFYEFVIVHALLFKGFQFFVNYIYDDLCFYLKEELEKDWFYEEPTFMITGLTHLPNLISAIGGITKKVLRDIERNKRRREKIKEDLKKQEEHIRQNEIENEKMLAELRKKSKEELKLEVKLLLEEMKEKYKKYL